jgi:L-fuconolactonase
VRHNLELLAANDLTFDLLCREPQLPGVVDELVVHHSGLRVCLNHLAKPDYSHLSARWRESMARLADLPHAYCKLSGMVTEVAGSPSAGRFRAHVDTALDLFSPSRCMYGSDWPVCRLAAEPRDVVRIAEELTAHLSPTETEDFWAGAATRCYRLADDLSTGA